MWDFDPNTENPTQSIQKSNIENDLMKTGLFRQLDIDRDWIAKFREKNPTNVELFVFFFFFLHGFQIFEQNFLKIGSPSARPKTCNFALANNHNTQEQNKETRFTTTL